MYVPPHFVLSTYDQMDLQQGVQNVSYYKSWGVPVLTFHTAMI